MIEEANVPLPCHEEAWTATDAESWLIAMHRHTSKCTPDGRPTIGEESIPRLIDALSCLTLESFEPAMIQPSKPSEPIGSLNLLGSPSQTSHRFASNPEIRRLGTFANLVLQHCGKIAFKNPQLMGTLIRCWTRSVPQIHPKEKEEEKNSNGEHTPPRLSSVIEWSGSDSHTSNQQVWDDLYTPPPLLTTTSRLYAHFETRKHRYCSSCMRWYICVCISLSLVLWALLVSRMSRVAVMSCYKKRLVSRVCLSDLLCACLVCECLLCWSLWWDDQTECHCLTWKIQSVWAHGRQLTSPLLHEDQYI